MTTKSSILLLVLSTYIIVAVKSDDDDLVYNVDLLAPQGFRVSVRNTADINDVSMWGCVYVGNSSIPLVQYTEDLKLQRNGWWTYQNVNARLKPNDKFRISFIKNMTRSDGHEIIAIQEEKYIVPANAIRLSV